MKLFNFVKRIIYTVIYPLSRYRTLIFHRDENKRWFVKLVWWPFNYDHLEMVSGSADFLDYLEEGKTPVSTREIAIRYFPSNKKKVFTESVYTAERVSKKLFKGAFYKIDAPNFKSKLFLCPVTLFVLGQYPKYIYINKAVKMSAHELKFRKQNNT